MFFPVPYGAVFLFFRIIIERFNDMKEIYGKVSTNLNFVEREKATRKFWEENGVFEKSIDTRKDGENYTFYDGPPHSKRKAAYRTRSYPCY